jgi:hypothetical protein
VLPEFERSVTAPLFQFTSGPSIVHQPMSPHDKPDEQVVVAMRGGAAYLVMPAV